ncbi:glycosyl transferase [Owenweeksia hongkongensis DSM 17368]|uniref:Glycosyl transferase n=1 Tax=Owenweeksia hongkongensis (strain DSM 17368 / CIP 108786 / JCM 12287 / NRRL B-23963 / UST20020801) TaxID=926562 RepID=G8R0A5_OWEHD|nr:glycosyltransferase [Owenweeksia hongkongensis]AEV31565.1 glycosyl transferase [Owenweeksia hongkongensis DSM 17368]
MTSLNKITSFYNERFGAMKKYFPEEVPSLNLKLSVVIPSYEEQLDGILKSLGNNKLPDSSEVEVVLVLNHSEISGQSVRDFHAKQYTNYHDTTLTNGVRVLCIKAFDLPKKKAGVGLARKIGMDAALNRFSEVNHDGLTVCLDGDCEVSPEYLTMLLKCEEAKINGLSIAFEHDVNSLDSQRNKQIIEYEIFLRYYVHALRSAAYPHAFHTIGSSMASRATAYAKIGGMNTRKAGEDFYFLHKLIPQGKFYDLTTTTVFPSARVSERVPFGTGRAMMEMNDGTKDFETLYNPKTFQDLGILFFDEADALFGLSLKDFPKSFVAFLNQAGLSKQFEDLKARSKDSIQFRKNFNHWMDGFKVLKYVHFCRDNFYPNLPLEEALEGLFGFKKQSRKGLLEELREMDEKSLFHIFRL